MSEEFIKVIGGHRVINRPLRHDELKDDLRYDHEEPHQDLYNYSRLECIDCGMISQGYSQAADMIFHDQQCDGQTVGEGDDENVPE